MTSAVRCLAVLALASALASGAPRPSRAAAQRSEEASAAREPSPAARRVLRVAERMIRRRVVVRGSCYGYIDTVYRRARVGARERVFAGPREGPYADPSLFDPGDWLFLVSRPDLDPIVTHSAIFVGWEDRERALARVISYPGGNQRRPGHYTTYDLSRVYQVSRPIR
jgi:hypothetical protein